ncbi:MAG TPA: hypothetical protein VI698_04585 [Nitrososphaerales archaeon]|nr:hypothetical protein [Nitrososphaerales archaeon]
MKFKAGDRVVSKSGKHGTITGTGKRGEELVKVVYDQTPTEFLVSPDFLDAE